MAPIDNFVNGANDAIVCAIDAIANCLAPITLSPLAPVDLIVSNVILCHYRQWRHSNVVR